MKKGTAKYVVGGIIVGVGVLMVTIALCIGGFSLITNFPEVTISPSGVHVFYNDHDVDNNENLVNKGDNIVDIKNIKNIDIDIEYGEVTIQTADIEDIDIQAKNIIEDRFKYGVEGNTLKIKYKKGFSLFSFGLHSKTKIVITLPTSITYDEIDIDNGAGQMKISDISAKKVDIDNGAGEIILKDFSSEEKLDISTGAGEIKLENVTCGQLKIDSGVGEVHASEIKCTGLKFKGGVGAMSFEGEIDGDTNIDTGVGEVRMTVYGNSSDYNFKVTSGVGKVTVNGNTPVQNTGGKYDFKVDTGVGEVRIDFKDR